MRWVARLVIGYFPKYLVLWEIGWRCCLAVAAEAVLKGILVVAGWRLCRVLLRDFMDELYSRY